MAITEHPIARETLEELLPRVRPRLKQILARYRVPAHEAEDLLQEALIATFRKWDTIDDPEAWLLITLRNRCVIYWRKRRASLTNAVDMAILELLSEPQQAPQERDELRWDLAHLLHQLSPRCQRLLYLRYRLGYDPQEVAAEMGYHPSSVRKVSRRCLNALTRALLTREPPKAN